MRCVCVLKWKGLWRRDEHHCTDGRTENVLSSEREGERSYKQIESREREIERENMLCTVEWTPACWAWLTPAANESRSKTQPNSRNAR